MSTYSRQSHFVEIRMDCKLMILVDINDLQAIHQRVGLMALETQDVTLTRQRPTSSERADWQAVLILVSRAGNAAMMPRSFICS
jgi:hypothetical protein